MAYLLAVDPSLTCSGWALFGLGQGGLTAVGKVRGPSPKIPLAIRLGMIQSNVTQLMREFNLGAGDFLVCESQTTMRDPKAAFKVEQVRGIFESVARQHSVRVPGRVNPRTVQHEVMGIRGAQIERSQVKQIAVKLVHTVYGKQLAELGLEAGVDRLAKHQDIVDAVLVGTLALARIDVALRSGAAVESQFLPREHRRGRRLPR